MLMLRKITLERVLICIMCALHLIWAVESLAVPQQVNPTTITTTNTNSDIINPKKSPSAYQDELSPEVLENNQKRHVAAVHGCEKMYSFRFTKEDFDKAAVDTEWKKYSFPETTSEQDEWPRPPFGWQDLARISQQPLLSAKECALLMDEVEDTLRQSSREWMEGGSRFGTPDDRVGSLMPLERLPKSCDLISQQLLPRIFSSICSSTAFDCLNDPSTLRLGGARIVRYDADAGQVELGFHRDFLLLTANIALNNPHEDFTDGGTIVEAVSPSPIRLETGHALLHPGDVRHAAAPISSGKRYVLVLFIIDTKTIPHDRYLAEYGERAMMLASQESDLDGKQYLLSKAAQMYSDAYKCGGRMGSFRGFITELEPRH